MSETVTDEDGVVLYPAGLVAQAEREAERLDSVSGVSALLRGLSRALAEASADLAAVEAVERWGRGEDCEVTWHRDGTVSAMMHVDDGFPGRCDTVTTAPTLAALGRALLAREADDAK